MDGNNCTEINWEKILPQLYAFANKVLKNKHWFRNDGSGTSIAGKGYKDYVHSAIEKYLQKPDSFNPELGTLVNYLKFSLIRGEISNDVKKHENKLTDDVFGETRRRAQSENANESEVSYLERMLPCLEASFDEKYDYSLIMDYIEQECINDPIVSDIFSGLYEHNLKRREIIAKYGMSGNDFNNGKRRLQTIIDNTRNKFKIDT